MKLLTYRQDNDLRLGALTANGVVDVTATAVAAGLPAPASTMAAIAGGAAAVAQLQAVVAAARATLPIDSLQLAPAVPAPSKILCVGLNYRQHAIEYGSPIPTAPIYFAKFANSLAAHGDTVAIPAAAQQVDYEVELVVVIGRRAKNVAAADALQHVFGYATGNDLTARDLQSRATQWTYGKAIDGFAPLGPYLVTADEVPDPQALGLKLWINGEQRQNSKTADMIFPVAELIADLSRVMTLEPGDLIYTGTPEGVITGMKPQVWLRPGDEIACEVEGLGRLVNRLTAE